MESTRLAWTINKHRESCQNCAAGMNDASYPSEILKRDD